MRKLIFLRVDTDFSGLRAAHWEQPGLACRQPHSTDFPKSRRRRRKTGGEGGEAAAPAQNLALPAPEPPRPGCCLDYFKGLLTGVSASSLFPGPAVLNTAARVIPSKCESDHAPRCLCSEPSSWPWSVSPAPASSYSVLSSSSTVSSSPCPGTWPPCCSYKYTRHSPASGPLPLFSLPGMLFSGHPLV